MAAVPSQQQVLGTLRTLLRTVRINVTSKNQSRQWHEFVMAQYRKAQHVQDQQAATQLRRAANDFTEYFGSVIQRQALVDRYNSSAADEDIVEKSARRVGLALPRITGEDFTQEEPAPPGSAAPSST